MKSFAIAAFAAAGLALAQPAAADDYRVSGGYGYGYGYGHGYGAGQYWGRRSINRRQYRQQRRIWGGLATGRLNGREFWRLQRGQARVRRMERRALSDGHLSRHEWRRIQRTQNRQSRRIWRQNHDGQRWHGWRGHRGGGWRGWHR